MAMKIRFCEHNKGKGKVYRKLKENHPELNVKIKDCLGRCGPCHKTPFALVDKKTVCAVDGEELYRKILAELE
jgi:uncharacterized protein YuzB (UPF0349 family)